VTPAPPNPAFDGWDPPDAWEPPEPAEAPRPQNPAETPVEIARRTALADDSAADTAYAKAQDHAQRVEAQLGASAAQGSTAANELAAAARADQQIIDDAATDALRQRDALEAEMTADRLRAGQHSAEIQSAAAAEDQHMETTRQQAVAGDAAARARLDEVPRR